jgi:hypothetical protein
VDEFVRFIPRGQTILNLLTLNLWEWYFAKLSIINNT